MTFPISWLFTPGSRPGRFAKAAATVADAIILDLEDAVAENLKVEARCNVVGYLQQRPPIKQRICVRINPVQRLCGIEDLVALVRSPGPPDYILVPKSEIPAELALVGHILAESGAATQVIALVESARGISNAPGLAEACPRLAALFFGAADYAADLGQQVGVFEPDFARAALVNAAAGGGLVAIDSPFFAIDRRDALLSECRKSRSMGYASKAAVHPSQLEAIAETFSATGAEQDLARRILAAAPDGVGVLDGKMIDIAMVRWARRLA